MRNAAIIVHAKWDDEAEVWVAESSDLPGLVTEAETLPELQAKLENMIPDLLAGQESEYDALSEIPMVLMSHQFSTIRLRDR